MPPRHRKGVADAVNPPKPMIPGNRSLRKTCSIAPTDERSPTPGRAGHVRPALSRPAGRLCHRRAHLAVAGLLRQQWQTADRDAAPWRPRIQVLDAGAVEPDVVRGPSGAKSLATGGQLPIRAGQRTVVRDAPGLGQQRFQRVPPVGNRGFRGRTAAYRPDAGRSWALAHQTPSSSRSRT